MVGIHVRSAFDSIVLDARCTRENIAAIKIVDRPVMAESRLSKTSYVGVLTPETSDRDSTRRQGLYGGDRVQTRSLAWTLRQQDCCPYKKRRLGYRLTAGWQGEDAGRRRQEAGTTPAPPWPLPALGIPDGHEPASCRRASVCIFESFTSRDPPPYFSV